MPQLELETRALLMLLPALLVGLGGLLSFRWRYSRTRSRVVQVVTACTLLVSSVLAYLNGLPALFCVVQLLIALPGLALASASLNVVQKVWKTVVSSYRWELVLLAVSPLLLAAAFWQLSIITALEIDDLDPNPREPLHTRLAKDSAYTDRGRQIHLFELNPQSKESFGITGDTGLLVSGTPAPYRSIRLSEADGGSNCVGWVFTGAHHLMQCSDVDMILEDNGYVPVQAPRPGDLIIYRDDSQRVTHAGRVAFLLSEDQPLIESKWGYQGAFLHLPNGSPFGTNWTYYRSPRSNHHLLLTSPPALDADADPMTDGPP